MQEASQIQIGSNRVTWAVEVTDAISMLSTITAALLAMATPQGAEDPRLEPRLQPKQLKKLNRLAQRWIRSELKWDENPRYQKKRDGDRTLFVSALARRSTKHDVLASVGDLLQIFDKVFPYERRRPTGTFQHHKELNYAYRVPRAYDPKQAYRSVLVLRTPEGPTLEALNRDLSDLGSWDDTIYVVPDTSRLITHQGEASTDLRSRAFQDEERQRIRHVLSAFGEVQREFRLDRRRIFLDCTRGTAAFGLRLATYFPSRFAGVILRGPFPVGGDVLLESLAGVRVLMECAVGNQVCIHLQRRLDALQPGNVTIVEAYNRASRVQIDTWLRAVKRPLFPPRVLLAPNNASFRKSHWVEIVTAEDPLLVPADQRPLVIAHADHEANRITIRARGVTEVGLYLNDHLIDLDRDPELIVNGVRIGPLQLQRSLRTVERYMRRAYDSTALYTAYHRLIIPRRVVSMRLTTFEPRQIARHGSSSPTPEFVPGGGRKSGTIAPRPNPMRRPVRASRPPAQGGRDEPDWTEPEEVVSKRVVAKPAAELEPTTKSGRGRWYAFQVGIPDLLPWLSVLCILAMVAVLWIARRGQASG